MAHYLVIAHGTADRADLVTCLRRITRDDTAAACTLLVTATDPFRHLSGHTPELEIAAMAHAHAARTRLEAAGIYLARTITGDGSPLMAAEDELRRRPDTYDAIVLCTPRPGLRAWLDGDLRTHIEERAMLPVFHFHVELRDPWKRTRAPRMPRLSVWWERTRLAPSPTEDVVPLRRQMLPVLALMALYLAGGLGLALTVNRGFLLNDAVALVVYTVVVGGLLLVLRSEAGSR